MGVALDGLNDLMALYDQPDAPSPTAAPSYRQALPLLRETFAEIASETAVPVTGSVGSVGLLKFAATRLHFDDSLLSGGIGVETIFPAGTAIVGVSVFVEDTFDAGTSNQLFFSWTGDLLSITPLTTTFAEVDDVGSAAVGVPVNGWSGFTGAIPQFTPVYQAVPYRVIAGYSPAGTPATQGQALIVYTIAAI